MADQAVTSEKPLTAEEIRLVALHMSSAIYHLHHSMEAMRHFIAKYYPRDMLLGEEGPVEKSLKRSQEDLADVLRIVVKDPADG